jgi:hypothetical protein
MEWNTSVGGWSRVGRNRGVQGEVTFELDQRLAVIQVDDVSQAPAVVVRVECRAPAEGGDIRHRLCALEAVPGLLMHACCTVVELVKREQVQLKPACGPGWKR